MMLRKNGWTKPEMWFARQSVALKPTTDCVKQENHRRGFTLVHGFPKNSWPQPDMGQIKPKIIDHIVKKEKVAKDIYGSLEKSRSIVRSLQDRLTEKQRKRKKLLEEKSVFFTQ